MTLLVRLRAVVQFYRFLEHGTQIPVVMAARRRALLRFERVQCVQQRIARHQGAIGTARRISDIDISAQRLQ